VAVKERVPSRATLSDKRTHYDSNYGNFKNQLYEQVRREAFGEDIGQNSWLTAPELDKFLTYLILEPGKSLLDVGCGAGGPALRIAGAIGCSVVGIDAHAAAITTANSIAAQRNLSAQAKFREANASQTLPFSAATFDAITCIDAINHFPDRPQVLTEWRRVLKLGGRILFTDPIVITGPLSNAEIATRTSAGHYLLVPQGYDEKCLHDAGLRLIASENITCNMAEIADRRRAARAKHTSGLREIEGNSAFEAQQEYLRVASQIAAEGRLSRFLFVAEKIE
jgi:cyclopropane fatty-acyl-phospholipid synthase-like methyltransferase